jgi:hypothetical protein
MLAQNLLGESKMKFDMSDVFLLQPCSFSTVVFSLADKFFIGQERLGIDDHASSTINCWGPSSSEGPQNTN